MRGKTRSCDKSYGQDDNDTSHQWSSLEFELEWTGLRAPPVGRTMKRSQDLDADAIVSLITAQSKFEPDELTLIQS